jgi:hypothetical protein
MKTKINAFILIWLCLLRFDSYAQDHRIYSVTGAEWIISFADISDSGNDIESIVRFAPVFNFQELINYDVSEHLGFFTGVAVHNVGFIYDVPNSNLRKKVRTYNAGIPLAIKVGNLDKLCVFAGYELELPISYKEKTFVNDDKSEKFNVWFGGRTPTFNNAVFAGLQFPYGTSIKFKYYLNNFYKRSYTESDEAGLPVQPYQNMDVNVFYVSVNFFVLKNLYYYNSKKADSSEGE